jgi:hypothetical protein
METTDIHVTLEGYSTRKQRGVAQLMCRSCMRCVLIDAESTTRTEQEQAMRHGKLCEPAIEAAPFVDFEGANV